MAGPGDRRGSDRRPPKQSINPQLRKYLQSTEVSRNGSPIWLTLPEIPTAAEMGRYKFVGEERDSIKVPTNNVESTWPSKEAYLESHYRLLREDAVSPLRAAIDEVRAKPNMAEKDSNEHAGLYDNVYITGLTFTNQGIAAHIEFSTHRAEKMIRWEQSKRLATGSMVALTTTKDMFRTICTIAIVAGRPLGNLNQDKPAIDIFFQDAASIEIDPAQQWFMVEARSAYFEAYRHTLYGLQKMAGEEFPLSEHLVHIQPHVLPPTYVQSQPFRNLEPIFESPDKEFPRRNILTDWPRMPATTLDQSQTAALRQILTKRVAIVQGPPGTGKTYVAVEALKLLLQNMAPTDPPIIVAAQTNHALDQLLRHVASFERSFIRLGSRTTDQDVVEPRTLRNVRRKYRMPLLPGCAQSRAKKDREQVLRKLIKLCNPLLDNKFPLTAKELLDYGALTQDQYDALEQGAARTVSGERDLPVGSIPLWLGRHNYVLAKNPIISKKPSGQYEEVDEAYEQLRELEAEQVRGETDDDYETPRGETIAFAEPWTGLTEDVSNSDWGQRVAQTRDLWKIPIPCRGPVYAHLRSKVIENIRTIFRGLAANYDAATKDLKLGCWEMDSEYLKRGRVIGVTTTGLNKYRGLLSSVSPKVVLIEEASETLEANIATACFPTTEHLILVGDHKQLRPHCACSELEAYPYYLAVSLFERLVNLGVEFSQLKTQRRMAPEIRSILAPIYNDLVDHPSVLDRIDIPGMGTAKSFFYTHRFLEDNDSAMSKINEGEAAMIVGFVNYLVLNGTKIEDITVLTFYNGQRKLILKGLRHHRNLQGSRFNVNTVDSYQGEENEVIILSLVRNERTSNQKGIGFLSIENRVCVALSRAKRGFYMFGNYFLLSKQSHLWEKVIKILLVEPRRIATELPVSCQTHSTVIKIKRPEHWTKVPGGGCKKACNETLSCGHPCRLTCHAFDHSRVNCMMPCERKLKCGHVCTEPCYWEQCICSHGHTFERYSNSDMASHSPVEDEPWNTFSLAIPNESSRPTSPAVSSELMPPPVIRPEVVVPKIEHRRMFVNKTNTAKKLEPECLDLSLAVTPMPPIAKRDKSPSAFEKSLTLVDTSEERKWGSTSKDATPIVNQKENYMPTTALRVAASASKQSSQPSSSGRYTPNMYPKAPNQLQEWKNFANGGHKAADEALEQKARDEAEERRRRADDDALAMAFSQQSFATPHPKSAAPKIAEPQPALIDISPAQVVHPIAPKPAFRLPGSIQLPSHDLMELAFNEIGHATHMRDQDNVVKNKLVPMTNGAEGMGRRVRHEATLKHGGRNGWYEEPCVEKSVVEKEKKKPWEEPSLLD